MLERTRPRRTPSRESGESDSVMATATTTETPRKVRLFDLPAEWMAALDLMDECGDELNDEQTKFFDQITEELKTNYATVADSFCNWIARDEAEAAHAYEYEESYASLRRRRLARADRSKKLLQNIGQGMNLLTPTEGKTPGAKVVTPMGRTISVQRQGAGSVELIEGEEVPDEFMTQPPPVPNKKAIAEAIKTSGEVPFARITEQSVGIRIKAS